MNMKNHLITMVLSVIAAVSSADICVNDGDAIGFLGDSITAYGHKKPLGYANLVIKGLEISGVKATLIPAGHGGDKASGLHARLNRQVLSKNARWVTVCCGVNDVWHHDKKMTFEEEFESYKKNMIAIFDECAASNVTVIVLTAPMTEFKKHWLNKRLDEFNGWLVEEAKRRGLRIADLNAQMHEEIARIGEKPAEKTYFTEDGVHMAFKGDCAMAWGVLRALGMPETDMGRMMSAWLDMQEKENERLRLLAIKKAEWKAEAERKKAAAAKKEAETEVRK